MPPPIRPKPRIKHEAQIVRIVQELELEGAATAGIVRCLLQALDAIRLSRLPRKPDYPMDD